MVDQIELDNMCYCSNLIYDSHRVLIVIIDEIILVICSTGDPIRPQPVPSCNDGDRI
jgi:hypothetical protein